MWVYNNLLTPADTTSQEDMFLIDYSLLRWDVLMVYLTDLHRINISGREPLQRASYLSQRK